MNIKQRMKPFVRFRNGRWECFHHYVAPKVILFPQTTGNTPLEALIAYFKYMEV